MKALESTGKATVVFGGGKTAARIAEKAAAAGIPAVLVTGGKADADLQKSGTAPNLTLLDETALKGCRGRAGDFTLSLLQNGSERTVAASTVVLAEADRRRANFSAYDLAPTDAVVSLSDLKARLENPEAAGWPGRAPGHVVFLHSVAGESVPVICREVMTAALRLQQDFSARTYLLVGNLKVAANGLEALYRRCKEAGVFFVKFTDTAPEIVQGKDGSVVIEYADEVANQRFSLRPDLTVVDEAVAPAETLAGLAGVLGLEVDGKGFAQADNVHRWTVGTNRRGVYAAGPARAVFSDEEKRTDANSTAAMLARGPAGVEEDRARIEPGLCIRCLTCFRLCPYEAIRITEKERVEVMAEACQRCGICAAECPRTAIRIPGLGKDALFSEQSPAAAVSITAFCCTRSAAQAGRLSARMGRDLPEGLEILEVPCAGTVSVEHLMAAFSRGADGVMVLSCHPDNCHSGRGNILARQRVELLAGRLAQIGVDPRRLSVQTLASNMGVEFGDIIGSFGKLLVDLKKS